MFSFQLILKETHKKLMQRQKKTGQLLKYFKMYIPHEFYSSLINIRKIAFPNSTFKARDNDPKVLHNNTMQ